MKFNGTWYEYYAIRYDPIVDKFNTPAVRNSELETRIELFISGRLILSPKNMQLLLGRLFMQCNVTTWRLREACVYLTI
jgi:hypothetical protein